MSPGTTGVTAPSRVRAVRASGLMETGPEEAFNRLTRLASIILSTPMVALTVVDDVRSFLKGAPDPVTFCGTEGTYGTPVQDTACQVVIDTGDLVRASDVRDDPRLRDLPQIERFGVVAWVGVPVLDGEGHVVGNLCAMDQVVRDWTAQEVEALRTLAVAAGGEIALRSALRTSEDYAAEVTELAEALQQSLIPTGAPTVAGAEIAIRFRAGGSGVEVMGDFYDVIPLEGGFGVVLGDVCGKGVPAARTTGMARSAVRTAAHLQDDPVAVLHTLNEVLHVWFGGRVSFLTAQYATFRRRASTGDTPVHRSDEWEVRVACGGHPPAYLCRAGGSVEQLAGGGRALGLELACPISEQIVHLGPGDSLVLLTDGITEARRPGTLDFLEEDGVIDVLGAVESGADADAIAAALSGAAFSHGEGAAADDSGVIVVRVRPH